MARDHGAKKVLVIGAPAARLEVTKRMGADAVLNLEEVADSNERRAWVRDRTEGRGRSDSSRKQHGGAWGLTLLRKGGRYLNIGAGGNANISVKSLPQEMIFHGFDQRSRATGCKRSTFWRRAKNFSVRGNDQREL